MTTHEHDVAGSLGSIHMPYTQHYSIPCVIASCPFSPSPPGHINLNAMSFIYHYYVALSLLFVVVVILPVALHYIQLEISHTRIVEDTFF